MAGAIKMTLSPREVKKVNRALRKYGNDLDRDLRNETQMSLLDLAADAKGNLKSNNSIATSRLINSVTTTPNTDRRGGFVIVNAVYGAAVEFGRKSGEWPNVNALITWVRKKITSDAKRAKVIAYFVGKSIFENGTKAKPFLMPAFTRVSAKYPNRIKKIVKKHERKAR